MPKRPGQILLGGVITPMAASMVVDMPWIFFLWPFLFIGLFLLIWGVAPAAVIKGAAALLGGARINRQLSKFDLWLAGGTRADQE